MSSDPKDAKKSWADDSSGSWADAADDNDEASHGGSAWGEPVEYDDERGGSRFKDEEFPAVGSQPTRRQSDRPPRDGRIERSPPRRGEERDERSPPRRVGADRDERSYGRDRYDDRERGGRDERGYGGRDRGYERDSFGGRGGYGGRGRDRGYENREREERPQVPFPTSPPWTAHVGNLPYDVREDDVDQFFYDQNCKVDRVRLLTDKDGRPKGYGYVEFVDEESLRLALKCHDADFMGRPIRVGVAERRKERETGFRRDGPRDNFRRDRDRDREGGDDEGKTWRSQRGKGPVADPLHADRTTEPAAAPVSPPPAKSNKPDPFGGARPVDSREAEKKLLELQKQKEEEERKKREEEKKKREDEAIKKKEAAQKQTAPSQPTSWRADKAADGKGGWNSKGRRNENPQGGRGTTDKRDPKKPTGSRPQGRKPDSVGRGDRKALVPSSAKDNTPKSKPVETSEKTVQPAQAERSEGGKKAERPPREAKAPRSSEPPAKIANNNAFALLGEDEEA